MLDINSVIKDKGVLVLYMVDTKIIINKYNNTKIKIIKILKCREKSVIILRK